MPCPDCEAALCDPTARINSVNHAAGNFFSPELKFLSVPVRDAITKKLLDAGELAELMYFVVRNTVCGSPPEGVRSLSWQQALLPIWFAMHRERPLQLMIVNVSHHDAERVYERLIRIGMLIYRW